MNYKISSSLCHYFSNKSDVSPASLEYLNLFFEGISKDEALAQGISANAFDELVVKNCLQPAEEPDVWETYNWMQALGVGLAPLSLCEQQEIKIESLNNTIAGFDFQAQLRRRSVRFYKKGPLRKEKFDAFYKGIESLLNAAPWLEFYFVIQNVEGYEKGIYLAHKNGMEKIRSRFSIKMMMEIVQGMWWANGSGFSIFLVVDIQKLTHAYPSYERGYHDLLLTLGRTAQEILHFVGKYHMGGWLTPALKEGVAHKFLNLERQQEAMYFIKIGEPDEENILKS